MMIPAPNLVQSLGGRDGRHGAGGAASIGKGHRGRSLKGDKEKREHLMKKLTI